MSRIWPVRSSDPFASSAWNSLLPHAYQTHKSTLLMNVFFPFQQKLSFLMAKSPEYRVALANAGHLKNKKQTDNSSKNWRDRGKRTHIHQPLTALQTTAQRLRKTHCLIQSQSNVESWVTLSLFMESKLRFRNFIKLYEEYIAHKGQSSSVLGLMDPPKLFQIYNSMHRSSGARDQEFVQKVSGRNVTQRTVKPGFWSDV